ncbi:MAG: cytochrome c3 family protein [Deltaproteobacteria bacterium]|nr:cytochrome c3 family protein [Candidatus Anaeroferrophillacea bacterium]
MMMKKRYLAGWLLGAVLVVAVVLPVAAQPESILLNNEQYFVKKKRPPVAFPHAVHMDVLACTDCHHRYEKGENVLNEDALEEGNPEIRCGNCHNLNNRYGLQQAFHASCTGCHRQMVVDGSKKTGPRTCGGCHALK